MRTLKGKYVVIFTLMLLLVVYQILLSFNIVPYFLTGEDLFLVLFLLLGIFLLLISLDLSRLARSRTERYGGPEVEVPPGEIDLEPLANREAAFFLKIQRYFKDCENDTDVLGRLLVASSKLTNSERASVLLYSKKDDDLFIFRTIGWDRNEIKMLRNTRISPGEGIAGRVFLEGKPLVVSDVEKGSDIEPKEKYSTKAFVSIPLFAGNEVVGVLNLTEKQEGAYSEKELDVLEFLVTTASFLLRDPSTLER